MHLMYESNPLSEDSSHTATSVVFAVWATQSVAMIISSSRSHQASRGHSWTTWIAIVAARFQESFCDSVLVVAIHDGTFLLPKIITLGIKKVKT